jgi:glyoxylase-like metal-dependent hydrolase (beta-lactamase superfamily II)
MTTARPGARTDRVVTGGTFSLDGQDFEVENNVWIVGDDREAIVIDPAHDAAAILAAVGDRRVRAVLCTHGHNDHINAAIQVADASHIPAYLHPDDAMLWKVVYDDRNYLPLGEGDRFGVAGIALQLLHTPGHSPGAMSFWSPDLETVFTGDTLFKGGPGATGRSFSSFPLILESIRTRLLTLPPQTRVLPGHGDETTIGVEAADYDAWVARGH